MITVVEFHSVTGEIKCIFNAAQPGVGRIQVLGSKKLQTEEEEADEQFFGH